MIPTPYASERSIVLVGMPASGKSTVAQVLARRLGWDWVDTDNLVEQATGFAAAEVIMRSGEGELRRIEAEVIERLAGARPTVVAAGGGALQTEAGRRGLANAGTLVCLEAPASELARRLAASHPRPVVGDGEPARLAELERRRFENYGRVPLWVATGGRTPEAVADAVLALAREWSDRPPASVPVLGRDGPYRAVVAEGLLAGAGTLLAAADRWSDPSARRLVVAGDAGAMEQHADALRTGLSSAGRQVIEVALAGGENTKSLDQVSSLYAAFSTAGIERRDYVLSFGGGAAIDAGGFAAATYLRGLPWVPVPTTLLAMVDAAVGGKTGVNFRGAKNQVGAFATPQYVMVDPLLVRSLPGPEIAAGFAEVVKAALIGDAKLLARLEAEAETLMTGAGLAQVISAALAVKADLVSLDPLEAGPREALNLGHTLAHALESATEMGLGHGQSVAIGLVAAARLAEARGVAEGGLADRVARLLGRLGLPTEPPAVPQEAILAALRRDKKSRGGRLRLVLPIAPGVVRTGVEAEPEELLPLLSPARTA